MPAMSSERTENRYETDSDPIKVRSLPGQEPETSVRMFQLERPFNPILLEIIRI